MIFDLFKRKASSLDDHSREVLDQALAQRAKMDMEFPPEVTTLKGLSCALSGVGENQLVLDVYGIKEPAARFVGAQVHCHFRIREGKGNTGFFAFTVQVTRTALGKNGALFFVTTLPDKVERSQRRKSLRMRPEAAWFSDLRLWPGDDAFQTPDAPPLLRFADLRQTALCRLENFSAGGMGLFVTRRLSQERGFTPAPDSLVTVYIRFAEPMRNQPEQLWLTARIVRAQMDPVTRDISVGLEFERVGTPRADGSIPMAEVKDNVVGEMSERLFEWHLRQNRERGLRMD
ncbi:hypothetical protein JCM15519_29250 [Fundidesulfovibrio butyratiphilus]